MGLKSKILYYSASLLLISCAAYQKQSNLEGTSKTVSNNDTSQKIYLIGDAGQPLNGNTPTALKVMSEHFSHAGKDDALLFLGDNVYPRGVEPEGDIGAEASRLALNRQLEVAKTFPGKVYFIPGNHDWYSGLKGLKEQEKMVEDAIGKNSFQPENGCPIEKIELSEDVVLLIVDSQWYITNWNNQPTINDNCEIKTRELFLDEFRGEIKKARGKLTLVAIHHPMYSNGPHDGRYDWNEHMKPLPIVGTLKNVLRTTSGISNADMSNPFYNDLRKNLIAVAQQNDNVIFLSGHEHSLQYIESNNLVQVISGSGSKLSPVRMRHEKSYGHGVPGFAILSIHKDQSVDIEFISAESGLVEFSKNIKQPIIHQEKDYPQHFSDSLQASIYTTNETDKSAFFKFLWGERYRNYYSLPVKAKTVNLDTLYGGLKPVRKGGGNQSKSLRLINPEGKQYVMRAIRKSATQYLQAAIFSDQYLEGQFNDSATEALILDVFTGSHPYAPLTVATLSEAIGVYHLNPQLFHIPKQKALKQFNEEFGDALYILEEHASDGHTELSDGKFTGDIISTADVLEEIHSDESVVVDQNNYLRARLFDMLIGDWDRHQDQWRWMEFKEKGNIVYRALPRDRDQAFSIMSDGFVLSTAIALMPTIRVLRKYDLDLKDVKGFNIEAYPLDMAFLTQMNKQDWDQEVNHIQEQLTESVIDSALNLMPEEVQDETLNHIKRTLIQRRDNLKLIADRYYRLISKYAVITATNKDDYIKVESLENGNVKVSLYRKKDHTIKDMFHQRTYDSNLTKEIWIYGLDDKDTFEILGKSKKIKIRLIGGQNNDTYSVENGRNIVIYDYKSKNNDLSSAKKARVKRTDDYDTNVYNYKKLRNNVNQVLPLLGANPDDGLRLGILDTYTIYGFERNPFTVQHRFRADYYFATKGYNLDYRGEFANVIGSFNLGININFHSPNFSINYFGYGNETLNHDDDLGLDYNRVKTRSLLVSPELIWDSKRGSKVSFGISYESIEVHNTIGRFVDDYNLLPDYIFDENYFAGVQSSFFYSNYDNKAYPTNGLLFNLEAGYKNNLDDTDRRFGYLIPQLGLARKLEPTGKLVLATHIKGHLTFGNDFEFYQAASIGGIDGLRGFRNQRFTGNNAFYQNTDLRYSFNRLKTNLIPVRLGVYGGFDYGRVWVNNDDSHKWHNSYGGGFFINAVDTLSGNLGVFDSSDGIRIAFGLGFGF